MGRFGRIGPVLVIIEAITFKINMDPGNLCGSRIPGNGPDPWLSLQSHLRFSDIATFWSWTGHSVPLTAVHSHTTLSPTVGLFPLQKTTPQNPPNK